MTPPPIRRSVISTEVSDSYRDLFDSEDRTRPQCESNSPLPESHNGDRAEALLLLELFTRRHHEPYYSTYIKKNLSSLASECGLESVRSAELDRSSRHVSTIAAMPRSVVPMSALVKGRRRIAAR
jgi:hypothetical protein